jgi:hypothetical protein
MKNVPSLRGHGPIGVRSRNRTNSSIRAGGKDTFIYKERKAAADVTAALFGAVRLIALRSPCCAQAQGAQSLYARSTYTPHPLLPLGAALRGTLRAFGGLHAACAGAAGAGSRHCDRPHPLRG